jgi:DNA-binding response OmpR family regulator
LVAGGLATNIICSFGGWRQAIAASASAPLIGMCLAKKRDHIGLLTIAAERHSRVVRRDEFFEEVWGFVDATTMRAVDRVPHCAR